MSHSTADRVEFARRAWPAHPLQPAPIHAETRRWLEPLNLSDDTAKAFVRAVDEAMSNVVEHAYAPIGAAADDDVVVVELTFWTEERDVYIEIVDHGRWRPPDATVRNRRGIRVLLRSTV